MPNVGFRSHLWIHHRSNGSANRSNRLLDRLHSLALAPLHPTSPVFRRHNFLGRHGMCFEVSALNGSVLSWTDLAEPESWSASFVNAPIVVYIANVDRSTGNQIGTSVLYSSWNVRFAHARLHPARIKIR